MKKIIYVITTMIAALGLVLPLMAHADDSEANMTAEWWQWAFSTPIADGRHPLIGANADYDNPNFFESCGNGQHGETWFLGGDFSGVGIPFERTCTIPAGQKILLAVINLECSTAEGSANSFDSAEQQAKDLQDCAESFGDLFSGTAYFGPEAGPLEEIEVKRIKTEDNAFFVYATPTNVIGLVDPEPNPSLAQADGQWVFLDDDELEPGGHYRLEFNGVFDDPGTPGIEFEIKGAYNLIISGEGTHEGEE